MRVRSMLAGGIAVAAIGFGFMGSPANAQEGETVVEIPVSNVFVRGDVGSSVDMGQATVDAEMVGRTCNVVATVTNQSSVHPGNKLVVTSGDSTVEIPGIEDAADAVTVQAGTLTLGDTISVSVVLGDDGATSLGSSLKVTCEALPETARLLPPRLIRPTPADPAGAGPPLTPTAQGPRSAIKRCTSSRDRSTAGSAASRSPFFFR